MRTTYNYFFRLPGNVFLYAPQDEALLLASERGSLRACFGKNNNKPDNGSFHFRQLPAAIWRTEVQYESH